MGDYFFKLTIPANTPEDQPAVTTVEVEGEVLDELAYLIPRGWSALAHFSLFYGIKQIYPKEPGTWVTGDRLYRQVPIKWRLPESPCKLTLKGYNEDDTYPHTIYMWLLLTTIAEARPWQVLIDFVAILKRLLGLR